MARRNPGRSHYEWDTSEGGGFTWQHVQVELLMDIRDELKKLNDTLGCYRVRRMTDDINKIDRRLQARGLLTTKRRKNR